MDETYMTYRTYERIFLKPFFSQSMSTPYKLVTGPAKPSTYICLISHIGPIHLSHPSLLVTLWLPSGALAVLAGIPLAGIASNPNGVDLWLKKRVSNTYL